MSKRSSSANSQEKQNQKSNLLQTLNIASGSIQRTARSRQAVFEAFEKQMSAFGWNGGVMLLDETGDNLILEALAYPNNHLKILKKIAGQVNQKVIGFIFPLKRFPIYQKIINENCPFYVESNTEIIRQAIPKMTPPIAERLIDLIGGNPTIFAPINIDKKVNGVIILFDSELTEDDIPAVEAFANHIAIALENADLFSTLEASESRQRMLFNQASDGIFVFNKDTELIDVNRSGCRMLGFAREELIGKRYLDLIAPSSIAAVPLQYEKLLHKKSIMIERNLLGKDGQEIPVEISAKLLPVTGMQAVVRDISSRIESEKALRRREKILEAVAFAAGQFLKLPSWEEGIDEVLTLLGQAARVSRVYIFANDQNIDGQILTSQKYEWTAPNIEPLLDSPELQNLPFEDAGFGRWVDILKTGEIIVGNIEDFPESEQEILQPQNILSILVVPIFFRQEWWGFIGFDECTAKRSWETSEIDALQAAAGTIGAAIERKWMNQQERQRRQEAELLMDITTALTSSLNIDQVLTSILVHLQKVVPFVSACIFLIEGDSVRAVAGFGLKKLDETINKIFSTKDDLFIHKMIQTRQPILLEDASQEPNFRAWGETNYVRGWMGVPLISREKVIGYVTLDSDKVGAYGKNETQLAQAFVNEAAIAIQNAQLFSETQRLLNQTQEQTQLLEQIMNIVPDGILLLDSERKIVLANKSGEGYLGRVADITEDGRLAHIGPYTLEELYQSIPTPSPWQELKSYDEQRLFEAAVWPLDRNREDDFWVLVLQDITEERSKQRYRAAQERLAIVGQMAAGIAHDFNNIMAVIMLYTQLLLQMPDLPAKEEKRLVTIFEQSRRASDLIHQILDFSRQSMLERRPLNLIPYSKELVYLLQRTLPENIEVSLSYQEGDLHINADPTRIQQIIMNLALNARDAMPEGGTLKLSLNKIVITKKQEKPLPDMARGKWLLLQITDNGKGISAENLPHIFEPFFTTKPFGEGTGLGLAQVYGIVKQHEGFIDVQSTPGKGTTFSSYFPIFEPEAEMQPQLSIELPKSDNNETILVVEDNDNARVAVVEILEMLNYKTLSASNGSDAISLFQSYEGKIDLVLSDVVMPVMDGAALHDKLTQIEPGIKMVMMTGYPLEQSGKILLNQNVIAWMQKPLHTEQIAQTIYQALNESNY